MKINMPLIGRVAVIMKAIEKHDELCGGELLSLESDLPEGTVYVTLARLEGRGWLSSEVRRIPNAQCRPHRFYRLTALGNRVMSLHRCYEKSD